MEREKIFELLINCDKNLKNQWLNHMKTLSSLSKEPEYGYSDIEIIIRFIVDGFEKNQTETFNVIFQTIEQLLNISDQSVWEFVTIGLIEGIQNVCGWRNLNYYSGFDKWLLPVTKRAWDDLIDFWETSK